MERSKEEKARLREFLLKSKGEERQTLSETEAQEIAEEEEVEEASGKKPRKKHDGPTMQAVALFQQLKGLFEAAEDGVIEFNPPSRKHPNEAELRAIRFAYCALGWSAVKISQALGRNYRTIVSAIYRHRYIRVREKVDQQLIKRAIGRMEGDVEAVTALTTAALKRFLTQAIQSDRELTVKDAKLISDIGANFHRILQLIKNKPTAIHANIQNVSEEASIEALVGVIRSMKEDPMFDMDAFLARVGLTREEVRGAIEKEGGSLDDFDA